MIERWKIRIVRSLINLSFRLNKPSELYEAFLEWRLGYAAKTAELHVITGDKKWKLDYPNSRIFSISIEGDYYDDPEFENIDNDIRELEGWLHRVFEVRKRKLFLSRLSFCEGTGYEGIGHNKKRRKLRPGHYCEYGIFICWRCEKRREDILKSEVESSTDYLEELLKSLPNSSGVYRLGNRINRLNYIGGVWLGTIRKQIKYHLTGSKNEDILNDVSAYGIEAFDVEVLVEDPHITREQCKQLESEYISKFKSFDHGYNRTRAG